MLSWVNKRFHIIPFDSLRLLARIFPVLQEERGWKGRKTIGQGDQQERQELYLMVMNVLLTKILSHPLFQRRWHFDFMTRKPTTSFLSFSPLPHFLSPQAS